MDTTNTPNDPPLVEDLDPKKILRPHHALRNIYNPKTVLVVASETSLSIPEDLKTFTEGSNGVNVRFAKRLPLPNYDRHPPIDAVVLVYKVFNRDSLKAIKDSIPYIDVKYLVGKCFVLVVSGEEFGQPDTEEIEEFAKRYLLPIHYASKKKSPDGTGPARLQLPSNLMSIYCPPVGNDVNSLIVNAAMKIP